MLYLQFILAHSGLLLAACLLAVSIIFRKEIHAWLYHSTASKKMPPRPKSPKKEMKVEIPAATEHIRRSPLSPLICSDQDVIDIEEGYEPGNHLILDVSLIFGLYKAILYDYVEIPGCELKEAISKHLESNYFTVFFSIEESEFPFFKAIMQNILKKISSATPEENRTLYIPECYQLFRSDKFKRINYELDQPAPQSCFPVIQSVGAIGV